MGTLIGGKYYSSLEYLCAGLIAAGISLFAKQSSKQVVRKLAAPNAPLGYTLCLLNLILDGYTNAKQARLCSFHQKSLPHTIRADSKNNAPELFRTLLVGLARARCYRNLTCSSECAPDSATIGISCNILFQVRGIGSVANASSSRTLAHSMSSPIENDRPCQHLSLLGNDTLSSSTPP